MIVTIDGPAGSGKSTVARRLAGRLSVPYLDTGAMYRAVAHAGLELGVDFSSNEALTGLARSIRLELDCGPQSTRVFVDGREVSEAIRTIAVSALMPAVATCSGVREILVEEQRRIGSALGSFVTEGRDQGGVVFPDAAAKFILDASLEERTRRRQRELAAKGERADADEVRADLRGRDRVDLKQWQRLLAPEAAFVIDTTHLSVEEVVDRMIERLVRQGLIEGVGGNGL